MLQLYNTLTRTKEEFRPIKPPHVGLYTCGPTVYNYPHIGNYRAYLLGDILKRYLKYSGYEVKHIMNLTDVDDKTIRDSQKAGKSLKDFTEFYSKEFFKDLELLNIEPANIFPKATENISEMISIIEKLLEKKIAYKGDDGSVYFNIKKFSAMVGSASGGKDYYGKLAHLKLENLKEGASNRIKKDEYEKENAQDFALWKAWEPRDGEIYWDANFGKGLPRESKAILRGRPGWHIECSAMSMKYLGETFDIHTGGVDLIFPHHENEIAQSEGATGHPFVKYWLHNEWLMVNGKKMSKSLKNFYTLRDIEIKGFSPLAYRYLTLQTHYRKPLNFTWESITAAQNALNKLNDQYKELGETIGEIEDGYRNKFVEAMDNDLETPQALALMWDLIKDQTVSKENKKTTILDFDKVLGLGLDKIRPIEIPEEIKKLAEERELARQNKDFKKSDELRDQIQKLGFSVKDTPEGPKISKTS